MTTASTRFLHVADPIATFRPAGDTTLAFMIEAQRRGVENFVCELHDLGARDGRGFALARPVRVRRPTDDDASFFSFTGDARVLPFDAFDAIWMRKNPPADELYLYACMLLQQRDPKQTLVLNDPAGLRVVHEKLFALQFPDLIPRQVVTSNRDALRAFFDEHERAVLKPLAFFGGLGVLAFSRGDKNIKSAIDLLTVEGTKPALAQEYLPGIATGDKRVLLLDGEPIGALLRRPAGDDVRANLAAGGTAHRCEIDDDDRRIAARLAPALREHGMFFVGLDVIGGKLTEVNVTSPTGVPVIDRLDGRGVDDSVEAIVMNRVFEKLAAR